jgi:methionine synthase / methylenetetrahydrofolate reductase (NADH)
MENKIHNKLHAGIVVFDGAMGTELYRRGYFVNTCYEGLNLSSPDVIREIHHAYADAGADILTTNTFGANANKLSRFGMVDQVAEINRRGVELAREFAGDSTLVAGSVGPLGEARKKDHARAPEILAEQIKALVEAGADFILFETVPTLRDAEYALKAIALVPDIPYVISFMVDRELESMNGEPMARGLALCDAATRRPEAVGMNCCIGAEAMLEALEKARDICQYPIIVQPNAGMPKQVNDRMLYMCNPEYITTYAMRYIELGAQGVGGCCGTGPEHIADIVASVKPMAKARSERRIPVVLKTEAPLLDPVPQVEKSALAAKLARGEWVSTVEIVPPRGWDLTQTIEKSRQCRLAGFDAVNIPDGPRASSRISPIITALEIQRQAGIETVLHCCCRDRNLIGMQADMLGCAGAGINNILYITGDPPKLGDYPFASAVFDVDSIGILELQYRLNRGVDLGGKALNAPTSIFAGSGADPNAVDMQRELDRTKAKVEAGAEFLITQPVFAVEPLLDFMEKIADLHTPVIAGIWPLASYRNAEFMRNEVPGVTVPDEVMERMAQAESKEAQKAEGIAIAREAIEKIRNTVQGIQVSAPFGNVQTAIAVIK